MSKAWMPMYWGDYVADTSHLSALQHGCYLLLICHYWQHGWMPSDTCVVQRICKCPNNQWKSTWQILQPFFSVERNNSGSLELKHKRIEAELAKAKAISLKRMVSGTKGSWASRGKTNQQRNYDQQLPRQRGDQSQSHSNLTSLSDVARAMRRRAAEEER